MTLQVALAAKMLQVPAGAGAKTVQKPLLPDWTEHLLFGVNTEHSLGTDPTGTESPTEQRLFRGVPPRSTEHRRAPPVVPPVKVEHWLPAIPAGFRAEQACCPATPMIEHASVMPGRPPKVLHCEGPAEVSTGCSTEQVRPLLPPSVEQMAAGPDGAVPMTAEQNCTLSQCAEQRTVAELVEQLGGVPASVVSTEHRTPTVLLGITELGRWLRLPPVWEAQDAAEGCCR